MYKFSQPPLISSSIIPSVIYLATSLVQVFSASQHTCLFFIVGSRQYPKWTCIVEMSKALSRTPVPQAHENSKTFRRSGTGKQPSLPRIHVNVDRVCREHQPTPASFSHMFRAWDCSSTETSPQDEPASPPPHLVLYIKQIHWVSRFGSRCPPSKWAQLTWSQPFCMCAYHVWSICHLFLFILSSTPLVFQDPVVQDVTLSDP